MVVHIVHHLLGFDCVNFNAYVFAHRTPFLTENVLLSPSEKHGIASSYVCLMWNGTRGSLHRFVCVGFTTIHFEHKDARSPLRRFIHRKIRRDLIEKDMDTLHVQCSDLNTTNVCGIICVNYSIEKRRWHTSDAA